MLEYSVYNCRSLKVEMNWLRMLTTPKVKAKNSSKSKDNLWTKCPACENLIYTKDLEDNLFVCSLCDHHFRLPVHMWHDILFDNKDEVVVHHPVKTLDDPIRFKDAKRYKDRLQDSRTKTGYTDAAHYCLGKIDGKDLVVFIMNFDFMGGSMGVSVGKTFVNATEDAIRNNAGFISITASGGARMQEGMLSLMQMPSTIASMSFLKEKRLPFINVFTNPTTGGVLASFATLGDIHISEPKALIGFAGSRVIESTIRQKLPEGFQRAEFLMNHGLIDAISSRKEMKKTISKYLNYLM